MGRSRRLILLVVTVLGAVGLAAACTQNPGTGGSNNQLPVAKATAHPGSTSMEIVFSSSGSFDPDGTIAGYSWNFGDGNTSTEASPTHSYATPDDYTVTLVVTDNLGATHTDQVSVTVPMTPNLPPLAVGTATPNEGPAPLVVQFSSVGSSDPEGGSLSYLWDFGDGVTSTSPNPSHSYAGLGNFAATLTVKDSSNSTDTATVPVSTWEAEIQNPAQGRCMDVSNSNTGNGTKALSYPCTGNPNQHWVLGPNGKITTALNSAKCLDAQGGGALGANVGIYDCNGSLYQRWAFVGGTLVNDQNDLCVAAEGGSFVPGTELVLATCSSVDPAQQWVIAKWQAQPFQRLRNTALDRCVGTAGNALSNGRAIADWTCTDDSAMAWYLDPNGLMLNRAGLSWCMDGGGGNAGNQVVLFQCGQGKSWQLWHVSGSQLMNNTNNLCLSRTSSNDLPGSNMVLAVCDANSANQKFAFEPPGQWAWQQMRNPVNGKCVGVTNTNNGTVLQTKACDANDAGQSWYLDGGGRLFHLWDQGNNGRCVDGNGGTAGKDVLIYDCNTQPWQRWIADGVAQTLVNDANDLCVEAVGTGLKLQACAGTDAQRWVLEPR